MTFRHGDTLVGFRGTLHIPRPVRDARFVVADQAARQSRSTRVNCMTRIAIRRVVPGGEAGPEAEGLTINIAPAGLLIEAAETDAVTGDVIAFRLSHPDEPDQVVVGEATVVRHGVGLVAVAISEESTEAHAALAALVVARSRVALHRPTAGGPGAARSG